MVRSGCSFASVSERWTCERHPGPANNSSLVSLHFRETDRQTDRQRDRPENIGMVRSGCSLASVSER